MGYLDGETWSYDSLIEIEHNSTIGGSISIHMKQIKAVFLSRILPDLGDPSLS